MAEQRAIERMRLLEFQLVRDADTNKVIGYLGDITPLGLMLLSHRSVESGARVHMRLQYHRRDGRFETPAFEAECVWSREPENGTYHESGYRILEPSAEVTASIAEVIEDVRARLA